jgi:hypothetical protein
MPKQEKAAGPARDSYVTMTEALEEEAPVVAEVKEEGAVVVLTEDDAPEEAVTEAVADPPYATESAGMVVAEGFQDESTEGAQQRLEGGDGGNQLEAEAGVLTGRDEPGSGRRSWL